MLHHETNISGAFKACARDEYRHESCRKTPGHDRGRGKAGLGAEESR